MAASLFPCFPQGSPLELQVKLGVWCRVHAVLSMEWCHSHHDAHVAWLVAWFLLEGLLEVS